MHPDPSKNGSKLIYEQYIQKLFKHHEEAIDKTLAAVTSVKDLRSMATDVYTAVRGASKDLAAKVE